jgi:hypothetical protein
MNAYKKEIADQTAIMSVPLIRRLQLTALAPLAASVPETLWAVLTYNLQQWIRLRCRPRWVTA